MFKLNRVEVLEKKIADYIYFYTVETDRYLYNSLSETLFKINSYRNVKYKKVKKESINKKTNFKKIFETNFSNYEPTFNLNLISYDYNALKYITDDFILINNFLHLVLFENCYDIKYNPHDIHETIKIVIEIFSIDTKYLGFNSNYDNKNSKNINLDDNESVLYSLNYYYDRNLINYYHEYLTEIQIEKGLFIESFFMDIPYIKEFLLLNIDILHIEFLSLEDFNYNNIDYVIKSFENKNHPEELFSLCNEKIMKLRNEIFNEKLNIINSVSVKDNISLSDLFLTYTNHINEIEELNKDIYSDNKIELKIYNSLKEKIKYMEHDESIKFINSLSNKFPYKKIFDHIECGYDDYEKDSRDVILSKISNIQTIPQFISRLGTEEELKNIYDLINDEYPWFENVTQHIFKQLILRLKGDQNICINPLIIQGNSGVGKTSYVNYITKLLNTPYFYYNTGGKSECLDFTGMSYGWKDSSPALIIKKIIDTNIVNPFFAIDELDKYISEDNANGGNLVHSLLEMLEPSTNDKFFDKFLSTNVDISKVNWIILINNKVSLDDIFLSRCDFIKADNPNIEHFDKILDNLYNSLSEKYGINKENIILNKVDYNKLKNDFRLKSNIREVRKNLESRLLDNEFDSFFNKKIAKFSLEVIK